MKIAISSGHQQGVALAYIEDRRPDKPAGTVVVQPTAALNIHSLDSNSSPLWEQLDKILTILRENLPSPWREAGFKPDDRLAVALPGVSTEWDRDVGENCVLRSNWPRLEPANFCVVDDTVAGLIAGAQSTRGICAVAGTGASVYMGTHDGGSREFNIGPPFKWDGFGALLGDHGSAFRLALSTLERICRDLNECVKTENPPEGRGRHGLPLLFEKLIRKIRKGHQSEHEERSVLQNWFDALLADLNDDWRSQVAELASVIIDAAEAGDRFAQAMVDEAAAAIVTTLRSALNHEDFADMHSVPIFCQGWVFRRSDYYFKRVQELLLADGKNNHVELARFRPCVGALLIAASPDWKNVPHDEEINSILNAIKSIPPEHKRLVYNRP